ncbi:MULTISPECIES: ABC transporter substrate-binding protein [unclassified Paenibacillus]|uniref:ABC transporter substrate-binding protein n=1 Tax=unclassified Paenibacillus TaxID=185978 RepID=UPI002F40F158
MKKVLKGFLPLLLISAMVLVAACGNNSGKQEGGNTPSNNAGNGGESKPQEVTLNFWTISLQPTFNDYINGVIAAYENEHPNVKIKWQDYPMDAIQTKLLASSASNEAPDVVNLNTEIALQMVNVGALADISQYISSDVASSYIDGIYNSTVLDGKAYAFPWYTSIQVLFMNKEILEKAGLDPNKAPATRDELHEMARTIKEKTGVAGYATEFTAKSHLANEGVPILTEDRTAAAFASEQGIAAAEEIKTLVEEGVIMKEIAKFDAQVQFYASEQTAFVLAGPTFINRMKTAAQDVLDKTKVVALPTGKGNVNYSGTMNLVVPSASKNQQEAANFAAYMTNAVNQLEFSKVANTIASTKESLKDKFFTESDGSIEAEAKVATVSGLEHASEYTLGVARVADINSTVNAALEQIILNKADAKATLEKAAEDVNNLLKLDK